MIRPLPVRLTDWLADLVAESSCSSRPMMRPSMACTCAFILRTPIDSASSRRSFMSFTWRERGGEGGGGGGGGRVRGGDNFTIMFQ